MPSKILTHNDLEKERLVETLTASMPEIEKSVFDEIMRFVDQFDSSGGSFSSGILSGGDLQELSARIDQTLMKAGYPQQVGGFLRDLNKVSLNTSLVLNSEGFNVTPLQLSETESKWRNLTAETMLNSGIRKDFHTPVMKILDESISYGNSIDATRKSLSDFVLSGKDTSGKLKSYLTQTARDSVNQLQGQQMQAVANEIGYAGITYIGGLLKDSRGQCTHWINDLKGFIPKEQLKHEIEQAYRYQAAKRIDDGVHRWGGMMPNTNESNFMVKRGGFNCTHTATPKRKK